MEIIPLSILNFIVLYLFYSPSVISNNLSNDLFKESIIGGVSYTLSVFFANILL
jgi:hypothetical protein